MYFAKSTEKFDKEIFRNVRLSVTSVVSCSSLVSVTIGLPYLVRQRMARDTPSPLTR